MTTFARQPAPSAYPAHSVGQVAPPPRTTPSRSAGMATAAPVQPNYASHRGESRYFSDDVAPDASAQEADNDMPPPLPPKAALSISDAPLHLETAPIEVDFQLPLGTTGLPLVTSPTSLTPLPTTVPSPPAPARPDRPRAITKHHESVEGKTPIDKTIYLDPCLRNTLFTVPAAIRATTDTALTAASAYGDGSFNWTTGAPIGGMAALAKSYILPADVKVEAENGGVSLRVAVVDEVGGGVDPEPVDRAGHVLHQERQGSANSQTGKGKEKAKEKGRTKARVEVTTNRGGVELEVIEIDANRQLDLSIETGKGDVLVLLPATFHGPVHITAEEPALLPLLAQQCADLVNPYESVWTTHVVPFGVKPRRGKRGGGIKHGLMKVIANYVPEDFREQGEYQDMAASGFTGLQKGSHSRINIKTGRGKVVLGYRESRDVEEAKGMGLKVGAKSRQKHWWSL